MRQQQQQQQQKQQKQQKQQQKTTTTATTTTSTDTQAIKEKKKNKGFFSENNLKVESKEKDTKLLSEFTVKKHLLFIFSPKSHVF